jgi:hypothetical protein
MTGKVTGSATLGAPTGPLYFTWQDGSSSYVGTLAATSATASAATLSFPAWKLTNGANTFIATFKGDSHYSAQSSAPLTITLNGSDFSLTTTTQEIAARPGKAAAGSIFIAPINSYSGTVAVSCAAAAGINCAVASAAPTVGTGIADTITVTAASTVAAGVYPMAITATGGGHVHTAQILVAYTPPAAAPTFLPAAGTYTSAQAVTISDVTPGAVVHYTTDGSTPTLSSAAYAGPVAVNANATLKAVAIAPSYSLGAVASASYTITTPAAMPTFSAAGGAYTTTQTVTISDATAGATIYYTINGTTPTTSSTKYTGAISVKSTETLKAIAIASGHTASGVASATYAIP